MKHILIVEDENNLREILTFLLEEEGYGVDTASNGDDAEELIKSDKYHVIICDIKLPGKDGFTLLEYKEIYDLKASYVMITSYGSVESAVEAMKRGAEEYITKPFVNDDFIRVINKIIRYKEIERENEVYKKEIAYKYTFSKNIIGKSNKMLQIFDTIERIAPYDSSVLITGASGTGKELIAKAIHFNSPRKNKPFVPINCGAIPEGLLESEFFGHVKGAFTGASNNKKGLFQQAEGGTILLDEISEMGMNLQVKLLRVLQEKEIRKIGDVNSSKINVRIVASTNKDLEKEVERGNFREDLYYRLNVVAINLPPLRDRKEDIPLLIDYYINKFSKSFNKNIKYVDKKALRKLLDYNWPGNIRELEHVMESAIAMCQDDCITIEDISNKISNKEELLHIKIPDDCFNLKKLLDESKVIIEKELMKKALDISNNNRTEAAKLLGISHRAFMYKMNHYEL